MSKKIALLSFSLGTIIAGASLSLSLSLSIPYLNSNPTINQIHLADVIDVQDGNWCNFSDLLIGDESKSVRFNTQPTAPTLLSCLKINVDSQDLVKVYKEELEITDITNTNAIVKPTQESYHFVKDEELTLPFTIFDTNDLSVRLGNFKFTHPFTDDLYSMSKDEAAKYVTDQLFLQATSDGLACLSYNQFSQLSLDIYDQNAFNWLMGKITLVTTQNSNIWVGGETLEFDVPVPLEYGHYRYFTTEGEIFSGVCEEETLDLSNNNIQFFQSNLGDLKELDISNNKIKELSFGNSPLLEKLDCSNNKLNKINLMALNNLTSLDVSNNNLTTIDVKSNDKLQVLNISHNNLTSLDIRKNEDIEEIDVSYNEFGSLTNEGVTYNRTLNFTNQTKLKKLKVEHNENIKYVVTNIITASTDMDNICPSTDGMASGTTLYHSLAQNSCVHIVELKGRFSANDHPGDKQLLITATSSQSSTGTTNYIPVGAKVTAFGGTSNNYMTRVGDDWPDNKGWTLTYSSKTYPMNAVSGGIQSILLGTNLKTSTNGFMTNFESLEYMNLDAVVIENNSDTTGLQIFVNCPKLGFYPNFFKKFNTVKYITFGSFNNTFWSSSISAYSYVDMREWTVIKEWNGGNITPGSRVRMPHNTTFKFFPYFVTGVTDIDGLFHTQRAYEPSDPYIDVYTRSFTNAKTGNFWTYDRTLPNGWANYVFSYSDSYSSWNTTEKQFDKYYTIMGNNASTFTSYFQNNEKVGNTNFWRQICTAKEQINTSDVSINTKKTERNYGTQSDITTYKLFDYTTTTLNLSNQTALTSLRIGNPDPITNITLTGRLGMTLDLYLTNAFDSVWEFKGSDDENCYSNTIVHLPYFSSANVKGKVLGNVTYVFDQK